MWQELWGDGLRSLHRQESDAVQTGRSAHLPPEGQQEARIADGQMNGWASYEPVLPAGSAQVFDAATVDSFANWDAQGQQKPLMDYFRKVHPKITQEQFSAVSTAARDLLPREDYKVVLEAH
jgi:hypothetical protein